MKTLTTRMSSRKSVGFTRLGSNADDHLRNEAYGWHFQYLTVIGLSLSTLTFIFAILADVTLSRRLFLIKNLLSVCSAPQEVLISVLYWGLRLVSVNRFFFVRPPDPGTLYLIEF
jgi:hypothetical protein